jgi:hypothetical protein
MVFNKKEINCIRKYQLQCESWFSFGYLKTEENQDGKGFIARPTDQRLKFGIYKKIN